MGNKYNFDHIIDRRNTGCIKYDSAAKRMGRDDLLPMWVADMDFALPDEILDALHTRISHGIFGYTDPDDSYFEVLINWFAKRYGTHLSGDWITVTPGIVYAIACAVRAYTDISDNVVIQEPVYYPFRETIEDNDRVCISNTLVQKNGKYSIDFDDLEEKLKDPKTKLMVISSPHNPVGRVFTREELEKISLLCLENGVKLFSDEIHCDFIYKGNKFTSLLALEDKYAENTVVATSISKTFNAAGFQVSNIIIKNRHMRSAFRKQNGANGYSQANVIGLEATKAAYTYGEEWLDELLEYLEGNLDFLRKYIKENIPSVKLTEPEGTYLLWLDFSEIVEDKKQLKELIINRARLWLDAGSIFGGNSELFERINIACPRQTLKEALDRLKTAVEPDTVRSC